MADKLGEHFIFHRSFAPAANRMSEAPFDRAESGLDVASLMIPREEFIAVKIEVMKRLGPDESAAAGSLPRR